jgi:hypothetical protein
MSKNSLRLLVFRLSGFALLLAGLSIPAYASVPELDPGSAAGAITLISCGLALFAGRRRRA